MGPAWPPKSPFSPRCGAGEGAPRLWELHFSREKAGAESGSFLSAAQNVNRECGADLSTAVCCLVGQLWGCWGVRGGDKRVGGSVCGWNVSRGWQNNPRAIISINLLAHPLPTRTGRVTPGCSPVPWSPVGTALCIAGGKSRFILFLNLFFFSQIVPPRAPVGSAGGSAVDLDWVVLPSHPCAAGLLSERAAPCGRPGLLSLGLVLGGV